MQNIYLNWKVLFRVFLLLDFIVKNYLIFTNFLVIDFYQNQIKKYLPFIYEWKKNIYFIKKKKKKIKKIIINN
jgi:hypothetical protein